MTTTTATTASILTAIFGNDAPAGAALTIASLVTTIAETPEVQEMLDTLVAQKRAL